ncbi:HD domain-containing phosphohydrolase [Chloroflexota bacterium]
MDTIRVFLVDDHQVIREGLRHILEVEADIEVVGEAATAEEALSQAGILSPEIVLMDIKMPGMNGVELTEQLKEKYPSCNVIMLTFYDQYLPQAIGAGASGYLQKDIGRKELVKAIRTVHEGRSPLNLSISQEHLPWFGSSLHNQRPDLSRYESSVALHPAKPKQLPNMGERRSFRNRCDGEKELKNMTDGIIHAMSLAITARDPYTADHQRRVAELACEISREMSFSEWDIEGIRIMGLLHDVGKMAVPAEILCKTGRVSQHEFNLIRTHPQVGYEMLQGIEFPWPTTLGILQHHERLDRSGYPEGLSAKDIIMEARILAVADVVEAISSHRPYRPALGLDCAIEQISQKSDTSYDAEVVNACISVFHNKKEY